MIMSLRALLALLLLAGLYLLTLLMIVCWLAFAALAVWTASRGPAFNTAPMFLAAAGFVVLALIVREVGRISQPLGARTDSVLVRPEQAAQLWATVRRLAEEVCTRAPTEIRLTAEANATVTDDAWLLGLRTGHRRLYLGVPLLVGLGRHELTAVLAHELGHYARHHVRFSGPALRGSIALAEAQRRIREAAQVHPLVRYSGPLYWTIAGYRAIFDRLTRPIHRRQELEADREAARIVGARATAAALRSVPAIAAAWAHFLHEYVEPVRRTINQVPDDPFQAFACLLSDPDYQVVLADLNQQTMRQPGFPGDTHPSLSRRLALLDRLPPAPQHPDEPDAAPDIDGVLFRRAGGKLPGYVTATKRPWRVWLASLAWHRVNEDLRPLIGAVRTAHGPDRDPLRLKPVLDLLSGNRSIELARALAPGLPQTGENHWQALDRLVTAVAALIGQSLVSAGRAYWAMNWTGPSRLVSAQVEPAQLDTWIRTAVTDPNQVPWLRRHLAALGIAETTPIDLDAGRDGEPASLTQSSRTTITVRPTTIKGEPITITIRPTTKPAGPTTITVRPGLDEAIRGRQRAIRNTAFAVVAGLLLLACLGWLTRPDESVPSHHPPAPRTFPE